MGLDSSRCELVPVRTSARNLELLGVHRCRPQEPVTSTRLLPASYRRSPQPTRMGLTSHCSDAFWIGCFDLAYHSYAGGMNAFPVLRETLT